MRFLTTVINEAEESSTTLWTIKTFLFFPMHAHANQFQITSDWDSQSTSLLFQATPKSRVLPHHTREPIFSCNLKITRMKTLFPFLIRNGFRSGSFADRSELGLDIQVIIQHLPTHFSHFDGDVEL